MYDVQCLHHIPLFPVFMLTFLSYPVRKARFLRTIVVFSCDIASFYSRFCVR